VPVPLSQFDLAVGQEGKPVYKKAFTRCTGGSWKASIRDGSFHQEG
jgi:hypothetical protein